MNGTCVRRAWLELPDGRTMEFEGRGWFCTSFDLGMPDVRENVNNRPDNDGVTDRTVLMGKRLISANIVALATVGARIDDVASQFAPFMVPANRPILHYVLDRGDNEERTMVVRGSGYSWPVVGTDERDIQLQWVAADPYAYGEAQQVATGWSGGTTAGRTYNRTYNWTYPPGSGSAVNATIQSPGDVNVAPYLRIFGPITSAVVTFRIDGYFASRIQLIGGVRIDAGHFLGVDCDARTAYLDDDPTQPWLSQLNWSATTWPDLPPLPSTTVMSIGGEVTTNLTQVQATWRDRYLS